MASGDDDIERLLREVEAIEGGRRPAVPAQPALPAAPVAKKGAGGRVAWAGAAAVGGGAAGLVIGTIFTFLPWVSGLSTAVGAAIGAALAALIGGPPRWFDKS